MSAPEPTLLWSPSILQSTAMMRADGSLGLWVGVTGRDSTTVCLDRRVWHPPVEARPVVEWLSDLLAAHLCYEEELLADWHRRVLN